MPEVVTIAVDATGGYSAPAAVVDAVGELSRGGAEHVYFTLVGDEAAIGAHLETIRHNPERISVAHAGTASSLDETAREAHDRPDSAVRVGCELVRDGHADALVTAGHPGATVLTARETLTMMPGVGHAALATVYPTWDAEGGERFSLILDVGASFRASADDLVNFAKMGTAYARIVTGAERPKVGLLNVSREARVGPPEIVEAARRLTEHESVNFVGTVEGHRIPSGDLDVIVCEGFAGDLAIKVIEGFADAAFELAENAYNRKFSYKMGLKLLSPGLRKIRHAVDFEAYGGAPLLGFERVVIVADPHSNARSMANAIKLAVKNVHADLPTAIAAMTS